MKAPEAGGHPLQEVPATSLQHGAAGEAGMHGSEPLTEELLERLLRSSSIEAYLDEEPVIERDLAAYLAFLLQDKGLTRAQVIRLAGVNATFGYQIFQGSRHPSRDTAIELAFGLGCSLREVQRLLRLAGHSELYCKVRRDAIIIFCIEHGLSRFACDDELWRFGEPTLSGEHSSSGTQDVCSGK